MLSALLLVTYLEVSWGWQLTLLHINDIHVRIDETNKYSTICKEKDQEAGKCFGGLARVQTKVKEYKNNGGNLLWLNAGDFFQGTVWYTQFKWKVVSQFNNMLNFDATTLGNHEFDDKIAGLVPFMKEQTAPIVVANLNDSLVPDIQGLYRPSIIKIIDGRKIGIVGYVTPETKEVSNSEDIIFLDEIDAVTKEAIALKEAGVDIIIALGHSGYEKDMEIARQVPHLDVVVGGHTHSFLYTERPDRRLEIQETVRGPYPTLVKNIGGHSVLVLQAYAFTKYLGHMLLTFSDTGDLIEWDGDPILLDNSVPKDPEVEAAIQPWKAKLTSLGKTIIGQAGMLLEQSRDHESILGNLVSDIMVWAYRTRVLSNGETVYLALTNSGGIRNSIDAGNITLEDLLTTFPFYNTFDLVTMKGRIVCEALEHSVFKMTTSGQDALGRFMQVSGFRVVYDLRKPPGSRLVSVDVRNAAGRFSRLEDDRDYNVVMTDYVIKGGDGYTMIAENKTAHYQGPLDTDVLQDYFKQYSPLSGRLEGRIVLWTEATKSQQMSSSSGSSTNLLHVPVLCSLVLCMLL